MQCEGRHCKREDLYESDRCWCGLCADCHHRYCNNGICACAIAVEANDERTVWRTEGWRNAS